MHCLVNPWRVHTTDRSDCRYPQYGQPRCVDSTKPSRECRRYALTRMPATRGGPGSTHDTQLRARDHEPENAHIVSARACTQIGDPLRAGTHGGGLMGRRDGAGGLHRSMNADHALARHAPAASGCAAAPHSEEQPTTGVGGRGKVPKPPIRPQPTAPPQTAFPLKEGGCGGLGPYGLPYPADTRVTGKVNRHRPYRADIMGKMNFLVLPIRRALCLILSGGCQKIPDNHPETK